MSEEKSTMKVDNLKISNKGYELTCEYHKFPVSFVNAIRQILLAEIPTVVVHDVQILENTSQLPHDMLKHRLEMLPINVSPDDASTVRDAKIELRMMPNKQTKDVRTITTDDFVVESNRGKIIMRDRDFDTPMLFLRLRPEEGVHVLAKLKVANKTSIGQVCLATTKWEADPEELKQYRKAWIEEKKDPVEFDNFYYQKYYARDENGRPRIISMAIESIGVLPAKEILKYAVKILQEKIKAYMKHAVEHIQKTGDKEYYIEYNEDNHNLGPLLQEIIYSDLNVKFVSQDVPHPLTNKLGIRLLTDKTAESVLKLARDTIVEYCSIVEKAI
jgi:DNA-directed RNA polymerase subunit L